MKILNITILSMLIHFASWADEGMLIPSLIKAFESDMKAKVGVLKNPSLITNGFYYTVVEYPHTREMVSYYVKDTIKFADELVITNNHYLQQNMNVSLQCMFDGANERGVYDTP